jgi:flagellar biosynthesis/type III secretory pathway M-ring protein FliF/YscJ
MFLLAEAPALPLHEAGKYVAGAYVVFVILILVYVAIMAAKLQRIERELTELARFAEQRSMPDREPDQRRPDEDPDPPRSEAEEAEEVAGNV